MKKLLIISIFVPFILFSNVNKSIISSKIIAVSNIINIKKTQIQVIYNLHFLFLKGNLNQNIFPNKRQKRGLRIIQRNTDPTAYWDTKTGRVLSSTGKILSGPNEGGNVNDELIDAATAAEVKRIKNLVNFAGEIPEVLKKYLGYVHKRRVGADEYVDSLIYKAGNNSTEVMKKLRVWYTQNQDLAENGWEPYGEDEAGNRLTINGINIQAINEYQIDDMIAYFLFDCESKGININKNQSINTVFESLKPYGETLIAVAFDMDNDNSITIKVDPQNWAKSNSVKRWYIIYHELGHDVLNFTHGNGGKMMFNFIDKDYTWDEFYNDKEFMLNVFKQ